MTTRASLLTMAPLFRALAQMQDAKPQPKPLLPSCVDAGPVRVDRKSTIKCSACLDTGETEYGRDCQWCAFHPEPNDDE